MRDILQLALEALEESIDQVEGNYISDWRHGLLSRAAQLDGMRQGVEQHKAAIAAIKEALAAPQGEPCACIHKWLLYMAHEFPSGIPSGATPLYTHPAPAPQGEWPECKACGGNLWKCMKCHPAPAPQYPLPNSLYPDSKDWMASNYAQRVEWLHSMYENARETLDEYLSQAPAPQSWEALYWDQVKLTQEAKQKMHKVNDLLLRKQSAPAPLSKPKVSIEFKVQLPEDAGA